jgi:hypothetical protein
MEGRTDDRRDRPTDRPLMSSVIIINAPPIMAYNKYYFAYRLAQLRESGIQFRIRQNYLPSTQPDTQPSSINVSLVTVAPILVLLMTGNIIGLLILMIEQFVHIYIFRTWSARFIR